MSKKILKYASTHQPTIGIPELILQLGNICTQVYLELEEKFNEIKSKNKKLEDENNNS